MKYTIQQLATITGITKRAIRYYDEINLLKPDHINSSGYRIYTTASVERLNQILFYRSLGIPLDQIKTMVDQPNSIFIEILETHYHQLIAEQQVLAERVQKVKQEILYQNKISSMRDYQRQKMQQWQQHEAKYGQEIIEKYGMKELENAKKHWLNLAEVKHTEGNQVENELFKKLENTDKDISIPSELAFEIFQLHQKWLSYFLPHYTVKLHQQLAEMYRGDERFTAYYDMRSGKGKTEILIRIIQWYT